MASFHRRALAFAIDLFCAGLLFLAVLLIVGFVIWYRQTSGELGSFSFAFDDASWWGKLIIQVLTPVAYFGLTTWLFNGRPPGKKLLGIRVISLTHERIPLLESVERALGYGVSILELGFGFWQFFLDPNHRTAEDRLADIIVVREPRKER